MFTRPSLPEPAIVSNSAKDIPSSFAIFFTNGEKNLSDVEKSAGATVSFADSTSLATSATATGVSALTSGVDATAPPSVSIIAIVCPT